MPVILGTDTFLQNMLYKNQVSCAIMVEGYHKRANYFILEHQHSIREHKSPWTIFQLLTIAGRWNYLSMYMFEAVVKCTKVGMQSG